jgi:hypothetical protein
MDFITAYAPIELARQTKLFPSGMLPGQRPSWPACGEYSYLFHPESADRPPQHSSDSLNISSPITSNLQAAQADAPVRCQTHPQPFPFLSQYH